MKTLLLTLALLLSSAAQANPPVAASAASAPAFTEAEVRKIDLANAKLTLRHAEIPHLDMPPMTMVFGVRDKALLAGLKPGDKLRAQIVQEGGRYWVLAVQR